MICAISLAPYTASSCGMVAYQALPRYSATRPDQTATLSASSASLRLRQSMYLSLKDTPEGDDDDERFILHSCFRWSCKNNKNVSFRTLRSRMQSMCINHPNNRARVRGIQDVLGVGISRGRDSLLGPDAWQDGSWPLVLDDMAGRAERAVALFGSTWEWKLDKPESGHLRRTYRKGQDVRRLLLSQMKLALLKYGLQDEATFVREYSSWCRKFVRHCGRQMRLNETRLQDGMTCMAGPCAEGERLQRLEMREETDDLIRAVTRLCQEL